MKFPTAVVLSVYTGRLLCDLQLMKDCITYLAGESVFTHQLPRVRREAVPVLERLYPKLVDLSKPTDNTNWKEFIAQAENLLGLELDLRPLTENEHESIDPESELAQVVHPSKIALLIKD